MTRVVLNDGPERGPMPRETEHVNYTAASCAECGVGIWVCWRTLKDKIPKDGDRFLCGDYRCKSKKE